MALLGETDIPSGNAYAYPEIDRRSSPDGLIAPGAACIIRRHAQEPALCESCSSMVLRIEKQLFVVALLVLCHFLGGTAVAQFDGTDWKWLRSVQLHQDVPEGPAAVPLESSVIEQCLPDLRDIRLVTDAGSPVPFSIVPGTTEEEVDDSVPANSYKILAKTGKWTDIWIDKSSKSLTRGVLIHTSSKDFVRKVEIRGSDSPPESYVIRLDGLIADTRAPLPIHCLAVFHPLNNFRYLHIRILDEDRPPIQVSGIYCYPEAPDSPLRRPMSVRIIENRRGASGHTIVGDLGESRFPLTKIVLASPLKKFAKTMTLFVSSTALDGPWERVFEGVIFRLRKEESQTENLTIQVKPQPHRYFKLVASDGEDDPFVVESIEVVGTTTLLAFYHRPGTGYRLYYGNPKAEVIRLSAGLPKLELTPIADSAWKADISPPQKPPPPVRPPGYTPAHQASPSPFRKGIGIVMLLIGLLLLFTIMLRSRSTRRRNAAHAPRIMRTRL